jgi:hypothetical protein
VEGEFALHGYEHLSSPRIPTRALGESDAVFDRLPYPIAFRQGSDQQHQEAGSYKTSHKCSIYHSYFVYEGLSNLPLIQLKIIAKLQSDRHFAHKFNSLL